MHFLKSLSFLIFTLVIHFFSIKLIATTHWNDQQAIQEVEERIVLNCRSSENFTFRQNAAQSLVDNVQNNTQQFVAPVIIWTTQKLSSILSNMFWIYDRKLRNRLTTNHHSTYTTGFVRGTVFLQGGESDLCPTYFQIGANRYKLSLNYNGSPATQQPGNYYLMQDLPHRNVLTFDNPITIEQYNSKDYQLHLLGETLRRKSTDPFRNHLLDEFHRIPVAVGIVMATKLIRGVQDADILNRFWQKGGAYHLFSSTYAVRRDNFNALMTRYMNRYGIIATDIGFLTSTLKIHAAEIFDYTDYEDTLGSLFAAL